MFRKAREQNESNKEFECESEAFYKNKGSHKVMSSVA